MSALPSKKPLSQEYSLKILTGLEKGVSYRIISPSITIGRGSENDISIPYDPKCSRQHVRLTLAENSALIENLTTNNKLFVDGEEVSSASLEGQSIFQLGATKFALVIKDKPLASLQEVPPQHGNLDLRPPGLPTESKMEIQKNRGLGQMNSQGRPHPKKGGKKKFYIYLGIGLAIFFAVMFGMDKEEDEPYNLKSDAEIQKDIEKNNELKAVRKKELVASGKSSKTYKEAQSYYIKGFRDYRLGLFERSLESFQACLSLFPSHVLCQRYLNLSYKKLRELIHYLMIEGATYRDQSLFLNCKQSYKNAMFMIKDVNNKTYKEAKSNYDICNYQTKGRY